MAKKSQKTETEKNKGGRPKGTYKIEMNAKKLEQLEVMAGYGLTRKQIASIIGIKDDTLTAYSKTNPEVLRALEAGKAKASMAVMKTAFEMATSGSNGPMTVFWLRAKEGWDARTTHNDELDPTTNVVPDNVQDNTQPLDDGPPIYVVEVNKDGKFERAKPRQISGPREDD